MNAFFWVSAICGWILWALIAVSIIFTIKDERKKASKEKNKKRFNKKL